MILNKILKIFLFTLYTHFTQLIYWLVHSKIHVQCKHDKQYYILVLYIIFFQFAWPPLGYALATPGKNSGYGPGTDSFLSPV